MERATGLGFWPPPPLETRIRLKSARTLSTNPNVPFLWGSVGDTIVVSAAGRSWSVAAHKALVTMLRGLKSKSPIDVRELVTIVPSAVRNDARMILDNLCKTRALVPIRT